MALFDNPVRKIVSGRAVVTTPGTEVQLSTTPVAITWVAITSEDDNTGVIAIGDSTVSAAAGATIGNTIAAGETFVLPIDDLSKVHIDARAAGEGVSYNYGQV